MQFDLHRYLYRLFTHQQPIKIEYIFKSANQNRVHFQISQSKLSTFSNQPIKTSNLNNQSNLAILLVTWYSVPISWLSNFVIMVPKHIFKINFFENKFEITVAFFLKLQATNLSKLPLCRNYSFQNPSIRNNPPHPKKTIER